jgi:glycosyltransferase involved in cell wall biosynthesis
MQVIAITTGSYPFGGASTNRHLSYLKGLANLNSDVKLIVLQPDNSQSVLSNKPNGTYEGVQFEYASWYDQPISSIIVKTFYRIRAHIRAVKIIKKSIANKSQNDQKLIVLLISPIEILPYIFISKKYKIPIFHERTEYPFIGMDGIIKKIQLNLYLKYIIPRFNGIYVISKALVEYFYKYVNEKGKILHLPMTVEFERLDIDKKVDKNKFGKYIAYCGSMYSDKDGIPDLIEAFNIFCQINTDTNLLLIGDNSDKSKFYMINNHINSSPFKHRIFCTGWVDRNQMPEYLLNADLLALARPDNIQAKGGFPTKLGEYLATGNPVVITDVGEHKEYLIDGISAYIAKPNDPFSFAEKLLNAINNPEEAKKIGAEGKRVALTHFNYQIQARELYKFLNSIQYHA